jgi:hypothetical protein
MNGLNDAFERLREVVPNMTAEQKLSKIETLRMAQAYIKTLASLVQSDMDPNDTMGDVGNALLALDTSSSHRSNSSSPGIAAVEIDMFELIN